MAEEMQAPNVGARIREARDLLGLTQMALADELALGKKGSGARTVQAWERNERTPRMDSLTRLARLANRPVSWFYEDDTEREAA